MPAASHACFLPHGDWSNLYCLSRWRANFKTSRTKMFLQHQRHCTPQTCHAALGWPHTRRLADQHTVRYRFFDHRTKAVPLACEFADEHNLFWRQATHNHAQPPAYGICHLAQSADRERIPRVCQSEQILEFQTFWRWT